MTATRPRAALDLAWRAAEQAIGSRGDWRAFLRDAERTRSVFENYLAVGAIAGLVLPSRIPPRDGLPRFMERRITLRTRLGPVLTTEIGNAWPIVKIFRDWEFDVALDWGAVHQAVEVGGHVGSFPLWVAAHAPDARVLSFEPEPRNFHDLRLNVEQSGLADRITTVNAAVAANDGRRALDVPVQRNRAGFATASNGAPTIEVDCVGLERYLDAECPGPIDVLKLDCEGAEWEILPSLSRETYDRVHQIFVGCHAHEEQEIGQVVEFLSERGFESRAVSTGSDPEYPLLVTLWGERT